MSPTFDVSGKLLSVIFALKWLAVKQKGTEVPSAPSRNAPRLSELKRRPRAFMKTIFIDSCELVYLTNFR